MNNYKNWKTTLTGWLMGLPTIMYDIMDAYQKGSFDAKHGITLIVGIGMIVLGRVSKDYNVTGGTIENKPTTPTE